MGNSRNRIRGSRTLSLLAVVVLAAMAAGDDQSAAPRREGGTPTGKNALAGGPTVTIDAGKIRGLVAGPAGDVAVFKGIP
jgi:hypothetical protein